METFMDKLAEKLNAGEIIKANRAADTEQMEKQQSRLLEYERCLEQMCQANQNLQQTVAELKTQNAGEQDAFSQLQKSVEVLQHAVNMQQKSVDELKKSMEEMSVRTNDFVHKENVKVYRNVQAVILEENAKQGENLKEITAAVESLKREVEAPKQTPGILKGILGVSIVGMLLAAGSVVFQLLVYLQII